MEGLVRCRGSLAPRPRPDRPRTTPPAGERSKGGVTTLLSCGVLGVLARRPTVAASSVSLFPAPPCSLLRSLEAQSCNTPFAGAVSLRFFFVRLPSLSNHRSPEPATRARMSHHTSEHGRKEGDEPRWGRHEARGRSKGLWGSSHHAGHTSRHRRHPPKECRKNSTTARARVSNHSLPRLRQWPSPTRCNNAHGRSLKTHSPPRGRTASRSGLESWSPRFVDGGRGSFDGESDDRLAAEDDEAKHALHLLLDFFLVVVDLGAPARSRNEGGVSGGGRAVEERGSLCLLCLDATELFALGDDEVHVLVKGEHLA